MTVSKKQHGCLQIIQVNKLSAKIILISAIVEHAVATYSHFPNSVLSIIMPSLETGKVYIQKRWLLCCVNSIFHFLFPVFPVLF